MINDAKIDLTSEHFPEEAAKGLRTAPSSGNAS